MQRKHAIESWLAGLAPGRRFTLSPASADASFRRYFRVAWHDEGEGQGGSTRSATQIVMDAPPTQEDVRPWLHVQSLFLAAGVHVPEVAAEDLARGFLLLSDLGGTTYLAALGTSGEGDVDALYRAAIDALVRIQLASRPGALPEYDRVLLKRELDLFPDWYIGKHVPIEFGVAQRDALDKVFESILAVNLGEPQGTYTATTIRAT